MSTTEENPIIIADAELMEPPLLAYNDADRLDYIANHLRLQTQRLDAIEAKVDAVGQLATNTEAFCREVRAGLEGMRKNPLMRGMIPPMPPGLIT